MTTPKALHSKKSPKWGTPEDIILRARAALDGVINLDPASSPEFNAIVQADHIFTEETNGLASPWLVPDLLDPYVLRVFLNPPGGLVKQFWAKLINENPKAIWIGFSVEQLCILQDHTTNPLDYSTCILRKRLSFTNEHGKLGNSPSHGNYITGLNIDRDLFETCFGDLGLINHGRLA